MASSKRDRRVPMVDWYTPLSLLQTGLEALASTRLGAMIDARRLGAAAGVAPQVVDFRNDHEPPRESITFDYMADTGDGWWSTYATARAVSEPKLDVAGEALDAGEFLILGGDEVYPTASKNEYARRLVTPFNRAQADANASRGSRPLYLIPGNHDWYDSLGAFSHRFLKRPGSQLNPVGAFRPEQERSYFAMRLPHGWHLWAVDLQLNHSIDGYQLDYFRKVADDEVHSGDRVILCAAEPIRVYGNPAPEETRFYVELVAGYAEGRGAQVKLHLAGDVHNYQRYLESTSHRNGTDSYAQTRIVSGGGGAFLHPNTAYPAGPDYLEPEVRYPDQATSDRLSWKVLLFGPLHLRMSLLIGVLYLLTYFPAAGTSLWRVPFEHPFSLLFGAVIWGGCTVFSLGHGLKGILAGAVHGLLHLGMGWSVCQTATAIAASVAAPGTTAFLYLQTLVYLVAGCFAGGTLFGLFLFVSLRWLRMHHNETFSALENRHYKHFIRFHIDRNGNLSGRVLGIDTVPKARAAGEWRTVDEFSL